MKRRLMIGSLAAAALAVLTLALSGPPAVADENYPTKPIRIIVPEVATSADC
jgi:tripartite-type tricarboxylate transporter receptor subunit TctC